MNMTSFIGSTFEAARHGMHFLSSLRIVPKSRVMDENAIKRMIDAAIEDNNSSLIDRLQRTGWGAADRSRPQG
jgi:hypothetical protein